MLTFITNTFFIQAKHGLMAPAIEKKKFLTVFQMLEGYTLYKHKHILQLMELLGTSISQVTDVIMDLFRKIKTRRR